MLRRKVLQSFKNLHKARKTVFQDDATALQAARTRINDEYRKYRYLKDTMVIEELVQYSQDVEKELKMTVVQARQVKNGIYELRLTPDTVKLDNTPYKYC